MGHMSNRASPVLLAVAILAGVVPVVGVNIAFWLAATAGHIPSCFVYLEGCTSVSATGRQLPESLVFKGTMLPTAMLILLYLYAARHWLQLHGDESRTARALPWIGLIAATFLVIYTSVLGSIDEAYATLRRIAVLSYLSAVLMAQLLITRRIEVLRGEGKMTIAPWLFRAKVVLMGIMLLLGLAVIPASLFTADSKTIERILEWDFCVLTSCYYVLTAFAWRADGFRMGFTLRN